MLGGSFDYWTAMICLTAGLRLDTLSSDSHAFTPFTGGRMRLTEAMSNFLNLTSWTAVSPKLFSGAVNPAITLEDVVRMTTTTPGQVINRIPKLGTLQIGAPGDVAIMEHLTGTFQFNDLQGHTLSATQKLRRFKPSRRAPSFKRLPRIHGRGPGRTGHLLPALHADMSGPTMVGRA